MDAAVGVVTETWLSDGESREEEIEALVLGTGLNMVFRNWEVNERGILPWGSWNFFSPKRNVPQKMEAT